VNNIDSHVREMATFLFEPHAAELRRRLEDVLEDSIADDVYVPASDRVVTLDHNEDSFRRAAAALEETLACLRENNEMDPDDKARIENASGVASVGGGTDAAVKNKTSAPG